MSARFASFAILAALFGGLGMLAGVLWHQGAGLSFSAPQPQQVPPLMLPRLDEELAPDAELVRLDLALQNGGLLNVWASWCLPCAVEHPHLMELAGRGVNIVGVAYADELEGARKFLRERGSPFRASLRDDAGHMDVQLGMVGVPTTYVVNGGGRIVGRVEGVFDPQKLSPQLRGELDALLATAVAPGQE